MSVLAESGLSTTLPFIGVLLGGLLLCFVADRFDRRVTDARYHLGEHAEKPPEEKE